MTATPLSTEPRATACESFQGEAMTTPFSVSVLTATKGNATKSYIEGANGMPIREPGSLGISEGVLEHVQVSGLVGFQALLRTLTTHQALVHGIATGSQPGAKAPVVTTDT